MYSYSRYPGLDMSQNVWTFRGPGVHVTHIWTTLSQLVFWALIRQYIYYFLLAAYVQTGYRMGTWSVLRGFESSWLIRTFCNVFIAHWLLFKPNGLHIELRVLHVALHGLMRKHLEPTEVIFCVLANQSVAPYRAEQYHHIRWGQSCMS